MSLNKNWLDLTWLEDGNNLTPRSQSKWNQLGWNPLFCLEILLLESDSFLPVLHLQFTSSSFSGRVVVLPTMTSSPLTRVPGAISPSSSNLSYTALRMPEKMTSQFRFQGGDTGFIQLRGFFLSPWNVQYAISELPQASDSERYQMQSHWHENDFLLWHKLTQQRFCTLPRFESESFWNTEMACWLSCDALKCVICIQLVKSRTVRQMCKIIAMSKTISQLFATSFDCEQALLFWLAKQATSERASELAGKLMNPANGMTGKKKEWKQWKKKTLRRPHFMLPLQTEATTEGMK